MKAAWKGVPGPDVVAALEETDSMKVKERGNLPGVEQKMFKVPPEQEGEPLNRSRAELHLRLHGRDGRSSPLLGQLPN